VVVQTLVTYETWVRDGFEYRRTLYKGQLTIVEFRPIGTNVRWYTPFEWLELKSVGSHTSS